MSNNRLPQTPAVSELLAACDAIYPNLTDEAKATLDPALGAFENTITVYEYDTEYVHALVDGVSDQTITSRVAKDILLKFAKEIEPNADLHDQLVDGINAAIGD